MHEIEALNFDDIQWSLVVWVSEFGRGPWSQAMGRDHNP
ncbi:MAG: DUF1501 domain-containing protein [Paludisphaera borealis]|nr:DUF1501 domain-containing protein [Paludisphaera borealis]